MTRRTWALLGGLVLLLTAIMVVAIDADANCHKPPRQGSLWWPHIVPAANCYGAPSATISSWVDADSPGNPIDEDGDGSETTTVTFTTRNADRVECQLDGAAFAPCTSPFQVSVQANNTSHTIRVRTWRGVTQSVSDATTTLTVCPQAGCFLPNTYWVATSGNNANTCAQAQSESTPKQTIHAAVACIGTGASVGAGKTVMVKAGTYNEMFDWSSLPGGTGWLTPFTLRSKPGDVVTLRPTTGQCAQVKTNGVNLGNNRPCRVLAMSDDAKYIIIQGVTLDGTFSATDVVTFGCEAGVNTRCDHFIRFLSVDFYNPMRNCLLGGGSVEVINSTLHDCGSQDAFDYAHNGWYMGDSSSNLAEGNFAHVCVGCGGALMAWDQHGTPSNNVFRNNVVTGDWQIGIGLYQGSNNVAYNNIIYGLRSSTQSQLGGGSSGGTGITIDSNCVDCAAYNNTTYDNQGNSQYGLGISVGAATTRAVVRNNIAYLNESGQVVNNGGAGAVFSNNLTTNPSFVNAAGADFHLNGGSAAIDAGVSLASIFTTDKDGATRPQGSAWDIGAYEFGGVVLSYGLSVTVSSTVNAAWTASSGHSTSDWIGLYLSTETNNNNYLNWSYVTNGAIDQSIPGSSATSGTINFPLLPSGTYVARYFLNDGFTVAATSSPFTVP